MILILNMLNNGKMQVYDLVPLFDKLTSFENLIANFK